MRRHKEVPEVPKIKGHDKRWSDLYPPAKLPNRRIAQRIGGDAGSMDKPVKSKK